MTIHPVAGGPVTHPAIHPVPGAWETPDSTMSTIQETIHQMGRQARAAAYKLAQLPSVEKNAILHAMAAAIRRSAPELLVANAKDLTAGTDKGLSAAMLDRLRLDEPRIEAMAAGIDDQVWGQFRGR